MKWVIETTEGHLIEVTNLFDREGEETFELWRADAVTLLAPDGTCGVGSPPFGAVHRVQ